MTKTEMLRELHRRFVLCASTKGEEYDLALSALMDKLGEIPDVLADEPER